MNPRTTTTNDHFSSHALSNRRPSPVSFGENDYLNELSHDYEHDHRRYYNAPNANDYHYRYHHPYRRDWDPCNHQSPWQPQHTQPIIVTDPAPQPQLIRTVTDNDVLCGRGGGTNNHPGNKQFRSLVKANQTKYLRKIKKDRPQIADEVVEQIRTKNPPGRFLKKDPSTGCWYDIGDTKAREKASQALREGACSIRKSGALLIEDTGLIMKPGVIRCNQVRSLKDDSSGGTESLLVLDENRHQKASFESRDPINSIESETRKALPWVRRTFKEIQFKGLCPHDEEMLKKDFLPPCSSSRANKRKS